MAPETSPGNADRDPRKKAAAAENVIKLSSPATAEFWKIAVLFEDDDLLALDKPARLLSSPDRYDTDRPNLMKLLHRDIARGAAWAKDRGLSYLANAHRLDFETTGLILLAKSKAVLVQLANQFGAEKPVKRYLALSHGSPAEESFTIDLKLAPDPHRPGVMRPDLKTGKKAITRVEVTERFEGFTLLYCRPLTSRAHQIRAHLRARDLTLVGDRTYGGAPLLLSRLKPGYRPKPDEPEKPLLGRTALHAESLTLAHPATGQPLTISSPWPKDLQVGLKYLRRYL